MKLTLLSIMLLCGLGCARSTRTVMPVNDFEIDRYMGKWYEIARFPHRFERGLTCVTADYSIKEDGSISVLNKGYNPEKKKWKSAKASGRFSGPRDVGLLKVAFFWPFWAPYKIFHLDKEFYQYALVTSSNYNYLWILSRTPTLDKETLESLIQIAESAGFDISKLIIVEHDCPKE